MTITRETLELAALAAGKRVVMVPISRDTFDAIDVDAPMAWRPHTDPGDAARLAVRLRIVVQVGRRGEFVHAWRSAWEETHATRIAHDGTDSGAERAYCEAVTLCAAAVGAKMKGGEGLALPRGRSSNRAPRQGEHACCGALENVPHKMGCDYKMR